MIAIIFSPPLPAAPPACNCSPEMCVVLPCPIQCCNYSDPDCGAGDPCRNFTIWVLQDNGPWVTARYNADYWRNNSIAVTFQAGDGVVIQGSNVSRKPNPACLPKLNRKLIGKLLEGDNCLLIH